MKSLADRAFDYVMGLEGYLADHPRDPGGLTAYGVTKRDHPDLFAGGRIPTKAEAKARILRDYWLPIYDEIGGSGLIACELLEAGVLCGPGRAVRFLQTAYNLLRNEGSHRPVKVDGVFGRAETLPAIRRYIEDGRNRGWEAALYNAMNSEQYIHFRAVANNAFLRGWCGKRLTAVGDLP